MTNETRPTRRKLTSMQLFGLMMVSALLAGGVLGALSSIDEDGSNGLIALVTGLLALGVGIGALWFCFIYWKRLDEAAREAHKFAWYWGGSLGLAVSGVLVGVLSGGVDASTLLWPGFEADASGYLMTGAIAVVAAQLVGYVLVWAGWWLWKGR